MAGADQSLVTSGVVLNHLARGGLKALGPIGEMINEVIFGTLDAQAAAEESAKLYGILSSIQDSQQSQADSTVTLVGKVNQQAAFNARLQPFMEQLIAALQNPNAATVSPEVKTYLQAVIDKHQGELAGISGCLEQNTDRLESVAERLEQATTRIVVPASSSAGTSPKVVSRVEFIKNLNKLMAEEVGTLVSAFPQFRTFDRPNSTTRDRIASLVGWADAKLPGGLPELYKTATELELLPH